MWVEWTEGGDGMGGGGYKVGGTMWSLLALTWWSSSLCCWALAATSRFLKMKTKIKSKQWVLSFSEQGIQPPNTSDITHLLLVFWSRPCCCCCCYCCGCDGASVRWRVACPAGGHLPAWSDWQPASWLAAHLQDKQRENWRRMERGPGLHPSVMGKSSVYASWTESEWREAKAHIRCHANAVFVSPHHFSWWELSLFVLWSCWSLVFVLYFLWGQRSQK